MPFTAKGPGADARLQNWFLAALPPDSYALLTPHLRTIELERGAVLQNPGEPIERVYFPHSGMLSIVAVMHDGGMVETATVGPSGLVGGSAALGASRAMGRALVQLSGKASCLPATRFRAAAQESEAIRELAVRCNDLLIAQAQQSVACNAQHTLEARLCRWLLQSHDCVDGDTMPLTQELLGQMLGVRRTSVTLTARAIQSAGLIRYRRGHIQVVDREGLEDAACECYAVIQEHMRNTFPQPSTPGG